MTCTCTGVDKGAGAVATPSISFQSLCRPNYIYRSEQTISRSLLQSPSAASSWTFNQPDHFLQIGHRLQVNYQALCLLMLVGKTIELFIYRDVYYQLIILSQVLTLFLDLVGKVSGWGSCGKLLCYAYALLVHERGVITSSMSQPNIITYR